MINKIKLLVERLLGEDYLTLEELLVQIGVGTYLAQEDRLHSNKEKQLRKDIEVATDKISEVIVRWLFAHGLTELAEELGGDYQEYKGQEEDFIDTDILEKIRNCVMEDYYKPLVKEINNYLGGSRYFGEVTEEEIKNAISPYIEEEEDSDYPAEEDEEPVTYSYFNGDESDVFDIIKKLKGEQVHNDSEFITMAENFVESIKNIKGIIDTGDIKKLVLVFDRLKDLSHYNGNLLSDYGDVDWDSVNDSIEERVKNLLTKK